MDYAAKAKELCASGRMYLRDESYQRSIAHHPTQCAFCPIVEAALIAADKTGYVQGKRDAADALLIWAQEGWDSEVKNRPVVNIYREMLDRTWKRVQEYAIRSRAEKGGEG